MKSVVGRTGLLAALAALLITVDSRAADQLTAPGPPPRDALAREGAPPGRAAIRGVVTSSGQPVAEAQVTIAGGGPPGGARTVTTDERGIFSATGLPAGRYVVTANKPGYVTVAWGQRRPRGSGRSISLADGDTRRITLELPRAGVITGTVLNERGEPLVGVSVQAALFVADGGQRAPRPTGGTSTDDRGVYRVHSLQPGEYLVCAAWMNHGPQSDRQRLQQELHMLRATISRPAAGIPMSPEQMKVRIARVEAQLADTPVEPVRGYAPACAGGPAAGAPITVAAADERTSIDLHLQRVELGSIEGLLVLPADVTARDVNMTLFRPDDPMPGMGSPHVMVGEDGRFSRDGLVPGAYRLEVRTRQAESRVWPGEPARREGQPAAPVTPRWASADVVVESAGTPGVVIELHAAARVSGDIAFEGSASPPDLGNLQVMAMPITPPGGRFGLMMDTARASLAPSGQFTLPGVFPGSYRLGLNAAGWYLKSAVLRDRELLDFPLEVGAGDVTGVRLTLTDRMPELSATVVDGTGQPATEHSLVLFPADERYWTPGSRRIRLARAATDGTFVFRGLPAGEYRIAAVLDIEPGELGSREFLQQLAWSSTRVVVRDGEQARIAVRVGGN